MEAKSDLRQLYELLKEDFPLKLTNALAVFSAALRKIQQAGFLAV